VRKGFAYCFNYDAYLNEVMQGEGVRSVNVMPPGMLGYDETTPIYTYDPAKCTEMLKQSRWNKNPDGSWTPDPNGEVSLWDTGFRFTVPHSPHGGGMGQILQTELGAVNDRFVVEVTGLPLPAFMENYYSGNIPIILDGWMEDIHDPHNWVVPFTIGSLAATYNLPSDIRSRFAEIIDRAVTETDPPRRAEIYKEFNQLYYDTASSIPLFVGTTGGFLHRWLHGWDYNPSCINFYALWKE